MAEFSEVIKQFKRMCNNGHCATATGCPMYPACNIGQCRRIAFERPFDFEQRVMEWAAEHPEPVYPTWEEWFLRTCQVPLTSDTRYNDWETLLRSHIPDDIAQKLGLEPKEGT